MNTNLGGERDVCEVHALVKDEYENQKFEKMLVNECLHCGYTFRVSHMLEQAPVRIKRFDADRDCYLQYPNVAAVYCPRCGNDLAYHSEKKMKQIEKYWTERMKKEANNGKEIPDKKD